MSSETLQIGFSLENDIKLAELVSKHLSIFDVEHELYKFSNASNCLLRHEVNMSNV